VTRIRARWPKTRIHIRGDAGFCPEAIMAWCEVNHVRYVLGLARNALATILVTVNLAVMWQRIEQRSLPGPLDALVATTSRCGITNFYSFFGVMNTVRREIVVEGSPDGEHWRPYEFRYKPGDLLYRLLQDAPPVLALLADNPFPGQPPKWVRATLYRYRYTTAAERATTGECWKREPLGTYVPPLSLESWAPR
jgi:hypothetical protein